MSDSESYNDSPFVIDNGMAEYFVGLDFSSLYPSMTYSCLSPCYDASSIVINLPALSANDIVSNDLHRVANFRGIMGSANRDSKQARIIHRCARCHRDIHHGDCLTVCLRCYMELFAHYDDGVRDLEGISRQDSHKDCEQCSYRKFRQKCSCGAGYNDAVMKLGIHSRCYMCRYNYWQSLAVEKDHMIVFTSVTLLMYLPIDILKEIMNFLNGGSRSYTHPDMTHLDLMITGDTSCPSYKK